MTAPDDATLRTMIAAATQGQWAPYSGEGPIRYPAPDGKGWTHSVCVGGYGDDHVCVLTTMGSDEDHAAANADLAALAPALAAEVLRLRDAVSAFLAAYDAEQTDDCDSDEIYRALDDARMGLRRVLGGGQ